MMGSGRKATSGCTRSYRTDKPRTPVEHLAVLQTQRLTYAQRQPQRWCLTTCHVCLCRS